MAAARHILIMCGPTEIDGHAFCLGFEVLATDLKDSRCMITYLIQGAIFRPRHISKKQEGLSLDICSLGELVDMYHAHEATIRHDKVYALLGMNSDDLSAAGLKPNYSVPWETLMRSLVKFLLGDQPNICTWDDKETAVIKSKGCVLGRVSSVTTKQDNRRNIEITFKYVLGNPKNGENFDIRWTLPPSEKPIKEGDVICLLQGAQKPTIVRSYEYYFTIIMITVTPLEQIQTAWSEKSFTRDFLLVWDWERSSENLQDPGKYDALTLKSLKIGLESQLDKATKTWNLVQILGDSGQYEKAKEKEREAIEVFERTLGEEHLHKLESQYRLIPLLWAAENGHNKVVSLILADDGIDLDLRDWRDRTPLLYAAENGHEAIVKLLLKTGKVNVNLKNNYGRTPLSLAAENGYEAVVQLLLKMGKVDVNSEDEYSRTSLFLAAENGHKAVVQLLLTTGQVDVDSKDKSSRTPLLHAAENGHEAVVQLLLKTGKVDINSKDKSSRTPLFLAAENGHEAVAQLLLTTGQVDVDSKDKSSRTPLSHAAGNGHEAVVQLLLKMGKVDVNSKDDYSRTPLSWATWNGHEAVAKLLLATGQVDVDSKDDYSRTPLFLAAENGHEVVVQLLLVTGKVDVDSKDDYSRTPLLLATENGHEAVVQLLLATGKVDNDSKDKSSRTPLSYAAENGYEAIVTLLLMTGQVDVN
jgi:ankyrin repeat protein